MVTFARKVFTFSTALAKHVLNESGFLPIDKIVRRYEICKTCEYFTGKRCRICGCGLRGNQSLLNKLSYPREKCPHNPPKWDAEI